MDLWFRDLVRQLAILVAAPYDFGLLFGQQPARPPPAGPPGYTRRDVAVDPLVLAFFLTSFGRKRAALGDGWPRCGAMAEL